MSLTNLTTKTPYAGNGVTTVFPFTFKVFQAADLVVTETTAAGVTTTLALNTDYTVTGVGLDAGGSITRLGATSPPPTGTTGLIRRVLTLTQTADIRNQSAFYASVHEDVFDKLAMVDQQQEEEIGRSVQLPEQFSSGVSTQLQQPVPGTAIGWNAAGNGLANLVIPGVTATYVASFKGRAGAVIPTLNDYDFSLISGAATTAQIATALTAPGPIGGTTASTISGTTITATAQFAGPGTGLTGTAASLTVGNTTQLGGVVAASYALLASPTFTGTPAAPTASPGTNTTQLATTAFVTTAVGGGSAAQWHKVILTTGTSWPIPSTVNRLRLWVQAAGAGSQPGVSAGTSNGGIGGNSGGLVIQEVDVTGGGTLTYALGAAGAVNSAGGDTTVTIGGNVIRAKGGTVGGTPPASSTAVPGGTAFTFPTTANVWTFDGVIGNAFAGVAGGGGGLGTGSSTGPQAAGASTLAVGTFAGVTGGTGTAGIAGGGGAGAGSNFGPGGIPGSNASGVATGGAGASPAGTSYGAGAGAGAGGTVTGGAGAAGIQGCLVIEYIG